MRTSLLLGIFAATTAFIQPSMALICGCATGDTVCTDACARNVRVCLFNCGIANHECYKPCLERIVPPRASAIAADISTVAHVLPTVSSVLAHPSEAVSSVISSAIDDTPLLSHVLHHASPPTVPEITATATATSTATAGPTTIVDEKPSHDNGNDHEEEEEEPCDDDEEEEEEEEEDEPCDDEDPNDGNYGAIPVVTESEHKDSDDPMKMTATTTVEQKEPKSDDGGKIKPFIEDRLASAVPNIESAIKTAVVSTAIPSVSAYIHDNIASAVNSQRDRLDSILERQHASVLASVSSHFLAGAIAEPTPAFLADINNLPTSDPGALAALAESTGMDPEKLAAAATQSGEIDSDTLAALAAAQSDTDTDAVTADMDPAAMAALAGGAKQQQQQQQEEEDEDCDDDAKDVSSSQGKAGVPGDLSPSMTPASEMPSGYPPANEGIPASVQQVRATVTEHTTVTSHVPGTSASPSIGMLHGQVANNKNSNSAATSKATPYLFIAGAAFLFFQHL